MGLFVQKNQAKLNLPDKDTAILGSAEILDIGVFKNNRHNIVFHYTY